MKGEFGGKLLSFLRVCGETISFLAIGFTSANIIGPSRIFKNCIIWTSPVAVKFNLKNCACKNRAYR